MTTVTLPLGTKQERAPDAMKLWRQTPAADRQRWIDLVKDHPSYRLAGVLFERSPRLLAITQAIGFARYRGHRLARNGRMVFDLTGSGWPVERSER